MADKYVYKISSRYFQKWLRYDIKHAKTGTFHQTCAKVPKRFGIQGSLSPRSGILMDLGPCVVIFVERLWKPRTPKFGYCAKPREPRTLKFGYHVKPRKPRSSKFGYHTNPGNPGPQKFVLSRNPGNLA